MTLQLLKTGADLLTDILYPPVCPICGRAITRSRQVCSSCRQKLSFVCEPVCFRCGRPLENGAKALCRDCTEGKHLFDGGRSAFLYDSPVRKAVLDLKYHGKKENVPFLAGAMTAALTPVLPYWRPDLLVPVPVYKTRLLQRGYNQAELLAEYISEKTAVPADARLVFRKKPTTALKKLNPEERRRMLRDAFECRRMLRRGTAVLIIDDIYTTGSTADALADLLKKHGAGAVYILTACIGRGK